MRDWLTTIPNVLDPGQCQTLLNAFLQKEGRPGEIGYLAKRVDRQVRRSTVRILHPIQDELSAIYFRLKDALWRANYDLFGFDIRLMAPVELHEYDARDKGVYGWHHSINWLSDMTQNKVTAFVPLAEDTEYQGGNLEFGQGRLDQMRARRQGSMTVVPAFMNTRITQVTIGTCYHLYLVARGPCFK